MNLFTYDEEGQKSVLVAEGVEPVKYYNDGLYHICDKGQAQYYVNEDDTILLDEQGMPVWVVEEVGEEEIAYKIIKAV